MSSDVYTSSFFAEQGNVSTRSARAIVPLVLELIPGMRSVVDIGCGSGDWLAVFAERGIDDYLGIDADHVPQQLLKIPPDRFEVHDLRAPLTVARRYDLAMSLEVGEHLPAAVAPRLVSELAALAPVAMFSAAIPHQVGTGHINCQWPGYWAELFASHGMKPVDAIRDRVWSNPDVEYWYAQNIILFATEDALAANPALAALASDEVLARVHPRAYMSLVDPQEMSLRWTVDRLRRITPLALRRLRS
jgi:SAM-dependent methyltransferase